MWHPIHNVHGAARRLSVIPFRDVKPCACEWSQAHRTSRGTIHTFPRFPQVFDDACFCLRRSSTAAYAAGTIPTAAVGLGVHPLTPYGIVAPGLCRHATDWLSLPISRRGAPALARQPGGYQYYGSNAHTDVMALQGLHVLRAAF